MLRVEDTLPTAEEIDSSDAPVAREGPHRKDALLAMGTNAGLRMLGFT